MANEKQFIVAVGICAILVAYFTQGQEKEKVVAAEPQYIVQYHNDAGVKKEIMVPEKDLWQELVHKLERLQTEYQSIESVIGDAASVDGARGVSRGLRNKMQELQEKMPAFLAELNQFSVDHSELIPFNEGQQLVNAAKTLNQTIAQAVSKLGIANNPTLPQTVTYQHQQNIVNSVPLGNRVGNRDPGQAERLAIYDQEGQPGTGGEPMMIADKPFVQGEPGAEQVISAAADRRDGKGGEGSGSADLNDDFNSAPAIQPVIQVIEDQSKAEDADGLNVPASKKRRAAKRVEGKPPAHNFVAAREDGDHIDMTTEDSKPSNSKAVRGDDAPKQPIPGLWFEQYKKLADDAYANNEAIPKPHEGAGKEFTEYFDNVMRAKALQKVAVTGSASALKKRARD